MAQLRHIVYGPGGLDNPGAPGGNILADRSEEEPLVRANERTLRERADQALAAMQAHIDRGTFNAAQRDAALLLCLRVNVALARLALGRLEAS